MINLSIGRDKELDVVEASELVHLLDAARFYDGQGDEHEAERQRIKVLCQRLGVKVEFV